MLIVRLLALFEEQDDAHVSIDIELKNEKLSFVDVNELVAYPDLRGKIADFSVWVYNYRSGHRISISSGGRRFRTHSTVSAKADTEAWCAGAIETVHSFLQTHKLWYHWFLVTPIGWLILILGYGPTFVLLVAPKETVIEKPIIFAWLAIVLTLFILWIGRRKLLPSSILRLTDEEGFIRRYASELSLSIALVSVALTIIGWFVKKSA